MAKIFYIGELWEGGTCLDRMRALQQLGHEVIGFNTTSYQAKWRILRAIAHRLNIGHTLYLLNKSILKVAREINNVNVIWIDKGKWIFPRTLLELRKIFKRVHIIHYTPDPQLTFHKSRYFRASIPIYDLMVTTKRPEVKIYRSLGVKDVIFVFQSYDPDRFKPGPGDLHLTSDICFIGHYEIYYFNTLKVLSPISANILVRGVGWQRQKRKNIIPSHWNIDGPVWGESYPRILRASKISLGLLSKLPLAPDLHTTRSIEIPACGIFLLAERTSDHQELFEEGKEAEFFDEPDELLDKARFYLKHDELRRKIAQAGYEKVKRLGLRNIDVVARILNHVIK